MKKRSKKQQLNIKRTAIFLVLAAVILSPLINLFIFDRYYDIEQFFVPDAYNYDVGNYAELGSAGVIQAFTSRADDLAGFDIQFSGEKSYTQWELRDGIDRVLRKGEIRNAGESRISKIRFNPIESSRNKIYKLVFIQEEAASGVQISYSSRKYCNECALTIREVNVNGNLNMAPVYQADDPIKFSRILFDRIEETFSD